MQIYKVEDDLSKLCNFSEELLLTYGHCLDKLEEIKEKILLVLSKSENIPKAIDSEISNIKHSNKEESSYNNLMNSSKTLNKNIDEAINISRIKILDQNFVKTEVQDNTKFYDKIDLEELNKKQVFNNKNQISVKENVKELNQENNLKRKSKKFSLKNNLDTNANPKKIDANKKRSVSIVQKYNNYKK